METNLISMEPAKAREAWNNYRTAVKKRHTQEDEILMRGYRHLAQGKKILDLIDVMKVAGVDGKNRPRLAIARASWEKCFLRVENDGACIFSKKQWSWVRDNASRQFTRLPSGTLPSSGPMQFNSSCSAVVPTIPPQFKPAGSLDRFHILWDATWTDEPPSDPILLRHLGRNVYAVLASWDLTPLEKALLR